MIKELFKRKNKFPKTVQLIYLYYTKIEENNNKKRKSNNRIIIINLSS